LEEVSDQCLRVVEVEMLEDVLRVHEIDRARIHGERVAEIPAKIEAWSLVGIDIDPVRSGSPAAAEVEP
jgi:hypothetical protein